MRTTTDVLDNHGIGGARRARAAARAGACALALAAAAALASARGALAGGGPVFVSTPAQLQQAVADPANAGKRIVLAPGTYTLSPAGPTGGRLELQTDMELVGAAGDSGRVIIDAALLDLTPLTSPPVPAVPAAYLDGAFFTGALRVGRGRNAVRWMTLRNAAKAAGFIETDLAPTPGVETAVTVEHCVIEGNARAIDFRLLGAASSGRSVTLTARHNVLRGNTSGMGQGIRVAALQQVSGATLRATLLGNQLTGNLAGLLAASLNSSGTSIAIDSKSNVYSGNTVGCLLSAAIATGAGQANDDSLAFDSHGDEFALNQPTAAVYADAGAGIAALAADTATPAANRASRNSTRLTLRDARFADNASADLVAFGARSANAFVSGTGDELLAVLLGGTRDPSILLQDSTPPEATNTATVVQHPGP